MILITFGILGALIRKSQFKQQTYNFAFLFCEQNAAHLNSTELETRILPFTNKSPEAVISVAFQKREKSHLAFTIFKVFTTPPLLLFLYILCIKEGEDHVILFSIGLSVESDITSYLWCEHQAPLLIGCSPPPNYEQLSITKWSMAYLNLELQEEILPPCELFPGLFHALHVTLPNRYNQGCAHKDGSVDGFLIFFLIWVSLTHNVTLVSGI